MGGFHLRELGSRTMGRGVRRDPFLGRIGGVPMGVGEVQGQDHPVWSWEGPSRLETWVKHWCRPVITPGEHGRHQP